MRSASLSNFALATQLAQSLTGTQLIRDEYFLQALKRYFPAQLVELVVVHVLLGVPLSFAWRRTRNLAGPALAHAVNDAVRNAFMLGL